MCIQVTYFIETEFRSQSPEFRMNFVRSVDESRGLRPPLNCKVAGLLPRGDATRTSVFILTPKF